MSEGTIHLQGEIPVAISETDIRTQCDLRCSLTSYIPVATITQVHRSIPVQIFNIIAIMSVSILYQSLAMRQIEDSQRLTYNLINHIVVTSMLPSSRQASHSRHIGCRHLHAFILATERQEFVLLPRQVHIDIKFHILLLHRSNRETDFKSLVAHRAYIRQQFVVGEWRNRHIIGIKHISRFGVIIFGSHDQPIVPQSHVGTNVPGGTSLPLQVWIIVSYHAHRHRRRAVY